MRAPKLCSTAALAGAEVARLLVVRHGPAEDPRPGRADGDRSLTDEGRARCRTVFQGLPARISCPRILLASPYLRAQQTAGLLAKAWVGGNPEMESWPELVPSGSAPLVEMALRARLEGLSRDEGLALVTHQPLVSDLVSHLAGHQVAFPPAGWALLAYERGGFRLLESSGDRP